MNIVHSGDHYSVYGDGIQTFDKLPAITYNVCFNDNEGFFLTQHSDLSVSEKIYGACLDKVEKTLKSFALMERNMGIILSGPKGAGKSVFARMLAKHGHDMGLPVLIVTDAVPGIARFIGSIEQECIVLFDEFEKVFNCETRGGAAAQVELLSLFDGIDNSKKLYVITCNETKKLNQYLLNRPGRFHYHFMIGNPSESAVREYMEDHLNENAKQYIDAVISFSQATDVTYDILRAIAFELNQGYSFSEALVDLNIEQDSEIRFEFTVLFENGYVAESDGYGYVVDMVCPETCNVWCSFPGKEDPKACDRISNDIEIRFDSEHIYFKDGRYHLDPENVHINYAGDWRLSEPNSEEAKQKFLDSYKISSIELRRLDRYYMNKSKKFRI